MPRGGGKTSQLIRKSAKTGYYIVCINQDNASYIQSKAIDMGLDIPFPITFHEFLHGRYSAAGVKGVLIDNADILLESVSTVPIGAITLSNK